MVGADLVIDEDSRAVRRPHETIADGKYRFGETSNDRHGDPYEL
jgi:hypothetical protein